MDDYLVPSKVLRDLFDLTAQRLGQLASEGVLARAKRGRYWLLASVRGYTEFLRDALARKAGGEVQKEYWAEKTRSMRLQADKQEPENLKACRKLILVEEMEPRLKEWAAHGVQAVEVAAERIEEMIGSEFGIELTHKHVREHLHTILRELESYPRGIRGSSAPEPAE